MSVEVKPLAEVAQEAIRVLIQELGPANTVRFVHQFPVGYGNYTEERAKLFAGMTLDDIVSEIKRGKAHTESRQ
jgi:predicted subunit of tRNA(5-methylaminomethyl-2-thiouridylate) methyltransferase